MTATILPFPRRSADADRLARLGENLRLAIPLAPRDRELALLIQMADSLLSNITDEGCDDFLARLESWHADNRMTG